MNADDLGLTQGVNRAIGEAHADGVVTSATLMACGAAFDDAIALVKANPGLSVGCHVVLVDGMPVSDPELIPSLIAKRGPAPGKFFTRISPVAARAMLGGFDPDDLVREIVAQVERIRASGVQVTHLDTHKHTHLFPVVLAAVVRAARICGVPAIRNPFVPRSAMQVRQFAARPEMWKRYGQVRVLQTLGGRFRRRMKRAGLITPDGIVGVVETGSMGGALVQTLASLPDGTWELVCHPGYVDDDLRTSHTRLLESREAERRLLTSPEFRRFLREQDIELINYRQFGMDTVP
ncbi:MAG TPA: ChbG/HpnK family deacetylase [Terriglobales bacterium]|nr:ChbG/HpnK family deacetylase [Terriglobales bacterium]